MDNKVCINIVQVMKMPLSFNFKLFIVYQYENHLTKLTTSIRLVPAGDDSLSDQWYSFDVLNHKSFIAMNFTSSNNAL